MYVVNFTTASPAEFGVYFLQNSKLIFLHVVYIECVNLHISSDRKSPEESRMQIYVDVCIRLLYAPYAFFDNL